MEARMHFCRAQHGVSRLVEHAVPRVDVKVLRGAVQRRGRNHSHVPSESRPLSAVALTPGGITESL
eukprot:6193923-Pleurochrysis_carterae.AAC.1